MLSLNKDFFFFGVSAVPSTVPELEGPMGHGFALVTTVGGAAGKGRWTMNCEPGRGMGGRGR